VPQLLTSAEKKRYVKLVLGSNAADMDDSALDDVILNSIPAITSFGAAIEAVLLKAKHTRLVSLCAATGIDHSGTIIQLAARLGSLAHLPRLRPPPAEAADADEARSDVRALHTAMLQNAVFGDDHDCRFGASEGCY
jgi:hypothetical protein